MALARRSIGGSKIIKGKRGAPEAAVANATPYLSSWHSLAAPAAAMNLLRAALFASAFAAAEAGWCDGRGTVRAASHKPCAYT